MICWCRLANSDKCLIWVQDVQSAEGCACVDDRRLHVVITTLKVKSIKQSKVKDSLSLNLQTIITITKDVCPKRPREYSLVLHFS